MVMECLTSKLLGFKNVKKNYYYRQRRLFYLGAQEAESLHPIEADTCVSFIKQCITLHSLKSVHASMLRRTHLLHHNNIFFLTNLVAQYSYLGCVAYAYSLFCYCLSSASSSTDVFLWNVMVRGLVDNAQFHLSLQLYSQMLRQHSFWPDNFTFPFVLKAIASFGDLELGVKVHGHVVQFGCESDVFVGNSLIAMYGKCERDKVAREVFDKMPERNVVSWSAMIGAYAQNRSYEEGLRLFWRMLDEIVIPNRVALLNAMACVHRENEADRICRVAAHYGLILDQSVQNAAMGMFARCGRIDIARRYFDGILDKDLVSWASMIEAYAQFDSPLEALELFKAMKFKSITTDSVTLLGVIRACSNLSSLLQARIIHAIITRECLKTNLALDTAVVDLYVKCGNLIYARRVFDKMVERNIISWSTMILGYGMHGHGREALHLFDQMKKASLRPDHILFVSVLSACSHGGLISEGWACFNSMVRDFAVTPRPEHYACMVDLLGRAGRLDEAYDFIRKMPIRPDAGVWGALLGACRIHLNVEIAEVAAKSLFELDMENPGRYVLLSNIYSLSGKREEADRIRALMKQRGVKKISGHTIIEIKNKVYIFVSGDRSHPQADVIYLELEKLMDRIRHEGYTPDMNFVFHDVEEETKEKMLYAHSEKLAIVFGLLNLGPETTIRIRKNLRVCGDCHTATKYISKVLQREIVVRDAHRFHHFKDGTCSCGDYW